MRYAVPFQDDPPAPYPAPAPSALDFRHELEALLEAEDEEHEDDEREPDYWPSDEEILGVRERRG